MDSIRVSEAPDPGSIPGEATLKFLRMFYAYVLQSVNHDFFYKGHCENLKERLRQHNSGMTESTRLLEENEKSQSYLTRFGKLLRMLLENAENPFISLRKEIDFLQLYLGLKF
jgi:hypothetical protein